MCMIGDREERGRQEGESKMKTQAETGKPHKMTEKEILSWACAEVQRYSGRDAMIFSEDANLEPVPPNERGIVWKATVPVFKNCKFSTRNHFFTEYEITLMERIIAANSRKS